MRITTRVPVLSVRSRELDGLAVAELARALGWEPDGDPATTAADWVRSVADDDPGALLDALDGRAPAARSVEGCDAEPEDCDILFR